MNKPKYEGKALKAGGGREHLMFENGEYVFTLYGFVIFTLHDYNRIRFVSYVFCVHAQIYPKFKLQFPGVSK